MRSHAMMTLAVLALLALAPRGSARFLSVVSYIYPCVGTPGCAWDAIDAAGAPTVGLVIINPNSGPGASRDVAYVDQVSRSRAAGISVLGYVHTSYGLRNASDVVAEIGLYADWYGVTQIFLDEVSTSCSDIEYYSALAVAIRANAGNSSPAIVINPGIDTAECYAAVADVIVGFEDSAAAYASFAPVAWMANASTLAPSRVWHIVYSASLAAAPGIITLATQRNAGSVFVTDAGLPNPYDRLPSYWAAELAWVGGTATATPSTSVTASPPQSRSASRTASATPHPTLSATHSATTSPSSTRSATTSTSSTRSSSASRTVTRSGTVSPSSTRSNSASRTVTRSGTVSRTGTRSSTGLRTETRSSHASASSSRTGSPSGKPKR